MYQFPKMSFIDIVNTKNLIRKRKGQMTETRIMANETRFSILTGRASNQSPAAKVNPGETLELESKCRRKSLKSTNWF